MYITLALISLSDKQICDMPSNMILIAYSITSEYLLQARAWSTKGWVRNQGSQAPYVLALTRALSQFCLLIIEIISGAA